MRERAWHARTAEEVITAVEVDPQQGLDRKEAARRLREHGPNKLKETAPRSLLRLFLEQFQDFMVLVLLGATAVSYGLGETGDAITIMGIVIVNAVLGVVQEYRAEKSLHALRELSAPVARVRREGAEQRIPAADVTVGDVLLLEAGDRPVADARLIEAWSLEVEESALTGESHPVGKSLDAVPERAPMGDRRPMVYQGTTISRGRAAAIVTAIGMNTEIGRIAALIEEHEEEPTPLQRRLEGLGKYLVVACLFISGIVVVTGVLRGEPPFRMFLAGVSLAVAAIPEGLPAIVTIALALGVQRMIERRAVVRKLPAVETLGSATIVCSDKTGTLTRNAMTVRRVFTAGGDVSLEDSSGAPSSTLTAASSGALRALMEAGHLCCNATVARSPQPRRGLEAVEGDPTEAAIVRAAPSFGVAPDIRTRKRRLLEVPFDSSVKRMTVIVQEEAGFRQITKGASEAVLPACTHILDGGRARLMTAVDRAALESAVSSMAEQALRVLAVAERTVQGLSERMQGLCLVGLIGLLDPPRPEARRAVETCQEAGVRTMMITGDHPVTAAAIAREVGILRPGGEVVTGPELDEMSDEQLDGRIESIQVCARVSPATKLRIVRALRRTGAIVAMTGDGVNDAPAIKEADIGISMGLSGTDVAKEAAAMVLSDDNFATIVAAIEEGRGIYDNIRKFVRYLLACNVGEVLVMFLAALAGAPLPLLPIQILWVNLVTDGLPAMALGVDGIDPDVMHRPPRPPREGFFARRLGFKIVMRGLVIGLSTLCIFLVSLRLGMGLAHARTMAFATLVCSQLFHVFDCRSEVRSILEVGVFSNPFLVAAVSSSLILLLMAIYLPALHSTFETWPLSIGNWFAVIAVASLGSIAMALRRHYRRVRWALTHAAVGSVL